ncbi:MAG: hypothetical protein KGD60_08805 [Candidatus Thorarchaeota archaeon]|nr:hypothetical protein [Candidatus Thorarchaeota archaeon]
MGRLRLKETLLVLGMVLLVISFIPSTLVSDVGDVEEGSYFGYLFQGETNPYITIEVWHDRNISFFIVSLEDSFRFIDGEPIEDLTILFSLENINEYSGIPDLGAPGKYFIFITTGSDIVLYTLVISRSLPHFWVLMSGLVILSLDLSIHLFQLSKSRKSVKNH